MHRSKIFEMFQSILTSLQFSLEFLSPFLKTGVIFTSLRIDGNADWYIVSLKLEWRISVKISAFSLMIPDGISESWQAFDTSKRSYSEYARAISIYFTIAFKTGSWMFSAIGSQLLSSGILRSGTIFEKKVFKTLAVSLSLFTILSFSVRVIFLSRCYLIR